MVKQLFAPFLSLVFILSSLPAIASTCQSGFYYHQAQGLHIYFIDTSSSQNDIISWNWSFGDGHTSTGQFAQHEYDHYGHYDVCLSITDNEGCENEICSRIAVHPEYCPAPDFLYYQEPGTLLVHFFDSSFGEYLWYWRWEFGDGNTSPGYSEPNPSHLYTHPGEYEVCLTVFDAQKCPEHICHTIVVEEVIEDCEALFSYTQIEGSFSLQFSEHSTSPLSIISWEWDFGDGTWSHLRNPSHTFAHEGEYTVCLRIIGVESSCYDETCQTVIVHSGIPPCQPFFNAQMDHGGEFVQLNNISHGTTLNTNYLWDFGDGTTSNEENPQHQYTDAGIYEVCLSLSDPTTGCSKHYCHPFVYNMAWHEINPHHAIQNEPKPADRIIRSHSDIKLIRYTNPVKDEILIEYLLYSNAHVGFEMFDLTGNRAFFRSYGIEAVGTYSKIIQLENIHPGLYVLFLTVGNERVPINLSVGE